MADYPDFAGAAQKLLDQQPERKPWQVAEEAYLQALTDQYVSVHEVLFRPLTSGDWQALGYSTAPLVGLDYGAPNPGETATVFWPRKHGKTAALSLDFEAACGDGTRALLDALLAGHQAQMDQRLHRLAQDLSQWEPRVRRDFTAVQQILEDLGIADGYGQLTIPQPVRPEPLPPKEQ